MNTIRKIAKYVLIPLTLVYGAWLLTIHVIAPPNKYKTMYMWLVYDLGLGYQFTEDLTLWHDLEEHGLLIVGPPTSWYSGKSTTWFRNGNIAYVEHYKYEKLHGTREMYNIDGVLLQQESFKDGLAHGWNYIYRGTDNMSNFSYSFKGFRLVMASNSWDDLTAWKIAFFHPYPFNEHVPSTMHPWHIASPIDTEFNEGFFLMANDPSIALDALKGRELKHYPDAPKGEQTILELLETRMAQIPMTVPIEEAKTVFDRTIEHEGVPLASFLVDDTGKEHPYVHAQPDRAYSYEYLGMVHYIIHIDFYERSEPE